MYSYRFAAQSTSGNERTQGFELWTGAHFGPDDPQPMAEWLLTDQSMHLWMAPLPEDLGAGVHVAKVTTVDLHGRKHVETITFEVREERPAPFFQKKLFEDKP